MNGNRVANADTAVRAKKGVRALIWSINSLYLKLVFQR